jgi:octaprenyl-diphosphate synthase
MRNGAAAQSALIRKAIVEGGLSDFGPVMQAMQETGALEYTRRQAEGSALRAREAIAGLPHSKYKDCLLELAAFAVTRKY